MTILIHFKNCVVTWNKFIYNNDCLIIQAVIFLLHLQEYFEMFSSKIE